MIQRNIGMMFLPHAANLRYLTGIRRSTPEFTVTQDHGYYVTGVYIDVDKLIFVGSHNHKEYYQAEVNNKPWVMGRAGCVCHIRDVVLVNEKGIEPFTSFDRDLSIIDC
ncbi:MAG: hypothetical protein HY675_27920 [Chloroflexi bacterium]|nr:hypothetical protein [Chloroflexota bacterium]